MPKGKVYLVGAGPGDPGLLTLKAKEVLSKADVVVYDALVHPQILALIPGKSKKIFRGHRSKSKALSQGQINALLVRLAKQGKQVARLKGGDPFVFGRGAEEALELAKHKIDFEVVPGVTAAVAVPAYAGIPVTHRAMNSSFTVVTGHEDPSKATAQIDWASLAENNGTIVFLMGLHTLPGLCERLMVEGKARNTPAAVIQAGTTPQQKTVTGTLETIAESVRKAGLKPPCTFVIGKVVELMDGLKWIKKKPLSGCKILVTRGRAQASYLSDMLAEEGAEIIEIPTIEISPLSLSPRGKKQIRAIRRYDWIVFSSVNAVEIFMDHLLNLKRDSRDLSDVKIACVGEATAKALETFGLRADLVPGDYKQEGLVKSFSKIKLTGQKILFARAKEGRDVLQKFFRKKGVFVDLLPLYENKAPKGAKERLRALFTQGGGVDLLTFASSSAVDHFYGLLTPALRRKCRPLPVAVIGPVTASSVKKWGGRVAVQPRSFSLPPLVKAIVQWSRRLEKR
jgi:uroporphyrinogen III methyltransferase / synthase